MSVLIKNMEMPKNCQECRFRQYEYCDMQRQDVYAVNIMDYALSLERHPSCPLIEIPTPHGRLIDADTLLKKAPELQEYLAVLATVVIEAEGSKDE